MSTIIGNLRVVLGLDSAAFQDGLRDAVGGLRRVGQNMQQIGRDLSLRASAPLAGAAVAATAAFQSSANRLGDLKRQADLAGLSVQEFKVAALAVEEFGISQEKLSDILKDVNDRLGDYRATGGGEMADFFEKIGPAVGVTLESFEGLSSSDALALYVSSLEKAGVTQAEMTFYMEAMADEATALIPVFRNGGKALDDMRKRAEDLGLSIDEKLLASSQRLQADVRLTSEVLRLQLEQAFLRLGPAISKLMQASMPLIGVLADIVNRAADWVEKIGQASPETLKWAMGLTLLAAAVGPLIYGIGLLVSGALALGKGLAVMGAAIKVLSAAFLTNPIALAAAAIAGAAYLIWDNWEQVGPWFTELFSNLQQIVTGFLDITRGIFTGDFGLIVEGFKQLWNGLTEYWQTLWDGIVGILTFAWESGIKPITDALGITDEIQAAWNAVKAMFDSVMSGIASAFTAAWEKVKPIIDKLSDAYQAADGFYRRASGGAAPSGGTNAAPGADVIAPPVPAGNDVAAGYVQGVTAGQGAAYGAGAALGAATEQGLRDRTETRSPSQLFARLGGYLAEGLSLGLDRSGSAVGASAGNLGQGVADGITPYFQNITRDAESLGDVFRNIKAGFADMLGDMASRLASSSLRGLVGTIFGGMFGGGDPLTRAMRGAGLPAIPAFATGVENFGGGWARINELGGELVKLPGGSTVVPHDLSRKIVEAPSSTQELRVIIEEAPGFATRVRTEARGVAVQTFRSERQAAADKQYLGG